MNKVPVSLSEKLVEKHLGPEPDDEFQPLVDAARVARAAAEQALEAHETIMKNVMRTALGNQRASRKVASDIMIMAGEKIDRARERCERLIAKIESETAAPPAPKNIIDAQLEIAVASRLANMSDADRAKAISTALADDDDLVMGAALRTHPIITGLGPAEREARRHSWRAKRFPAEIARVNRLRKGLDALERCHGLMNGFVLGLTDGEAIKHAELAEKSAAEAVERATAA